VFLFTNLTDSDYYRILGIPHVIRFLGAKAPEPLPAADAEYITWLSGGGAAPLEPSDIMIVEGDEVKVMSGPLKGREGMIVRLNRRQRRAVLAISFSGRTHEISLSVNVLLKSASTKQG
jgi:transcriptional antiterminator NusG